MTPNEEMQAIVEKAGSCWHNSNKTEGDSIHLPIRISCSKCGAIVACEGGLFSCETNPSPTDLNELFRLAEKLGFDCRLTVRSRNVCGHRSEIISMEGGRLVDVFADTPADSLREALYRAVKEQS